MIQKELAGKAGESANVALLIPIKETGGNHSCNSRTSSFPSNGSHPPPWPCSAHPTYTKVCPVVRESAGQALQAAKSIPSLAHGSRRKRAKESSAQNKAWPKGTHWVASLEAHLLAEVSPQLERAVLCLPAAGTPLHPVNPVPPGSAHGDLTLATPAVNEDEAQTRLGWVSKPDGFMAGYFQLPQAGQNPSYSMFTPQTSATRTASPKTKGKVSELWDWKRLEGFMREMLLQWRKRKEELEPLREKCRSLLCPPPQSLTMSHLPTENTKPAQFFCWKFRISQSFIFLISQPVRRAIHL